MTRVRLAAHAPEFDANHLCTVAAADEYCWWEVGEFDGCEYPVVCVVVPTADVERLRAERCD